MSSIVSIILILASVGVFWVYTNPTYTASTGSVELFSKSIVELQSEEKDYNEALSKTREIELVREGLLSKYKALDPQKIGKLEKLVPDNIDSVRLIIDINDIAYKYGMSLSNIVLSAPSIIPNAGTGKVSPSPGSPQSGPASDFSTAQNIGPNTALYDSVKLSFSISGSYDSFLSFVKALQNSLRIVDITSVLLAGTGGSSAPGAGVQVQSGAGNFTYSMTIRTYYLK